MGDVPIPCPLCERTVHCKITEFATSEIGRLYRRVLGIDVEAEFDGVDRISFILCDGCGLKFFHPAVTGSQSFYEALQSFTWYYQEVKSEYIFAAKFITHADRVLEVGCGKGAFATHITANRYSGLEMSESARTLAGALGNKILLESVEDHVVRNEENYNIVCCFQVLEHVANVSQFIRACTRCLRPNGLLILSVPNADAFISQVYNNPLNMPPHHVTWWSGEALSSLGQIFGLQLYDREVEFLSDNHCHLYLKTLSYRAINGFIGGSEKIVDLSIIAGLKNAISAALARFLLPGLASTKMRPPGHSITLVFRKTV